MPSNEVHVQQQSHDRLQAPPPPGYKIVESEMHMISRRDIVFFGGCRSFWEPARRAGESGGLRRFSVARAVASPIAA